MLKESYTLMQEYSKEAASNSTYITVNVKFTLEQATKTQSVSRGIALLFL